MIPFQILQLAEGRLQDFGHQWQAFVRSQLSGLLGDEFQQVRSQLLRGGEGGFRQPGFQVRVSLLRHPLADGRGIASSIAEERRLLEPVRAQADVIIDTSELSLRQLRERLFAQIATPARPDQLALQILTFGFKHGVPLEADLVFDVRFMQNPYYIPELRLHSGLTDPTREYVLSQPVTERFLEFLREFLAFSIPAYVGEGKTRLTIAIGCTGGFHRSIAIGEALAAWLREQDLGPVSIFHRELDRS